MDPAFWYLDAGGTVIRGEILTTIRTLAGFGIRKEAIAVRSASLSIQCGDICASQSRRVCSGGRHPDA
jgi:hypothetical protein